MFPATYFGGGYYGKDYWPGGSAAAPISGAGGDFSRKWQPIGQRRDIVAENKLRQRNAAVFVTLLVLADEF